MLNHAGKSYITHRKQLCLPLDTDMSHRRQLYYPLVYLFCMLFRLGSGSTDAVGKQSKQRSGILKRNEESASSVFHSIWLCFYFKMSHNILVTCLLGRLYQNISPSVTRKPWLVMSPSAFGIGWHNAPRLSCLLGANILVCYPRSHVIYGLYTVRKW